MDETAVLKRKSSRPRTGTDAVQRLKQGFGATERDLLAIKVGAKQLPHQVSAVYKIKMMVVSKSTRGS